MFDKPLSDKAIAFAETYRMMGAKPGTKALAARAAGYSASCAPTMAGRLLKDPRIVDLIEEPTE